MIAVIVLTVGLMGYFPGRAGASPLPTVTSLSPAAGPIAGGTRVLITGTGFVANSTTVSFGTTAAAGQTVNSATTMHATSPAGTGTVDVTVSDSNGTSATSSADSFSYLATPTVISLLPAAGPIAGGTRVIITGTGFVATSTTVSFGTTAAAGQTVNSATMMHATAPPGTGTVDITVTTSGGTSATSSADQFSYVALPTVVSLSPAAGPSGGGTTVVITGTSLSGASAVDFGSTAATGYSIGSPTEVSATAPPGTGTVDITVTTSGGTSATSSADQFSYVALPTVVSLSPAAGPSGGGTTVVITGTSLSGASAVDFGSPAATGYSIGSPTEVSATAPPGTGTVDITVTTSGGTSATSSADQFSYVALPVSGPPGTTVPTATPAPVAPPVPVAPPGPLSTVPSPVLVPTGGGVAATPTGAGYWVLDPGGQLSEHGNAGDFGSTNSTLLNARVVAVNSTADGDGYWLAAADGGVFAFGDAGFYGSMGGRALNAPVVAMARTADNGGYLLAAADGGVFAFGDAKFVGSLSGTHLNQPVTSMVSSPDGKGYLLAAADGGVFAFGDARFYGSLGAVDLNRHIVGITSTPTGKGYWLVGANGAVYAFGDARFYGSLGKNRATDIVGIVADANLGYRLITAQGYAIAFGAAPRN